VRVARREGKPPVWCSKTIHRPVDSFRKRSAKTRGDSAECAHPTTQEDWDDDDDDRRGTTDHTEARLHEGRDPRLCPYAPLREDGHAFQKINAAVGLRITLLVGTMWAAYLFALLAFYSLPSTIKQHSATVLVLWLSSEFLQLVLLPIIIVGQNVQSRAADARATKTFEDVEDARKKIEEAIDLLDVRTEGGLHDAVAMIIDAINAKAAPATGGAAS
jgi:hypothetical protein